MYNYEFRTINQDINYYVIVSAETEEKAIKIALEVASDKIKAVFKGKFDKPIMTLEEYRKTK